MAMKLSPAEAAVYGGGQQASSSTGSIWSVTEKKFTRYLRKREQRGNAQDNPRLVELEKEHVGVLFGKNRERLQRIENRYEVKLEIVEDGDKQMMLKIHSGSDLDLPLVRQEFEYANEIVPVTDPHFVKQHGQVLKEIGNSTKAQVIFMDSSKKPIPDRTDSKEIATGKDSILVRGPRPAVNHAIEALEVHFSYYAITKEMLHLEKELDDCKFRLQKQRAGA